MGRKGSARGPSAERCFLVGPFRSAARADAPLCREAFSSSLVRMDIGLPALQLRFLAASCLAGACAASDIAEIVRKVFAIDGMPLVITIAYTSVL